MVATLTLRQTNQQDTNEVDDEFNLVEEVEETYVADNPFAGQQLNNNVMLAQGNNEDFRWESSFTFEVPEYHGIQLAEELLDWFATVEEILECKRVPLDRCVPMITIRF